MWSIVQTASFSGVETEFYPLGVTLSLLCVTTIFWFYFANETDHQQVLLPFLPDPVSRYLTDQLCLAHSVLASAKKEDGKGCPRPSSIVDDAGEIHHRKKVSKEGLDNQCQPKMTLQEAHLFVTHLQYRAAGFLHSTVSIPLCVWVMNDPKLLSNPLLSTSLSWHITGFFTTSYFIWDVLTVILTWNKDSWQWLLHALICLSALGSSLFVPFAPMCYFGGGLLIHELSTPFLSLRWCCVKAGHSSSSFCQALGYLFALSFFVVRLVWAPIWLYPEVYHALFGPVGQMLFFGRRWLYYVSIPLFFVLNVYWFYLIAVTCFSDPEKTKKQRSAIGTD